MTLVLPIALLVLATCLWLWLGERDHQRRRRSMGLSDEPTTWSAFLAERREQRLRAEARAGISEPIDLGRPRSR